MVNDAYDIDSYDAIQCATNDTRVASLSDSGMFDVTCEDRLTVYPRPHPNTIHRTLH